MGEYDDMFRPSIDQRLQQAARERADLSAAIDQIATLRAEVERLKGELLAHHDADGILQSQLEAAQLAIDEGKAWRQRCEQAEAQLCEAQATIERLREGVETLAHEWDNEHDTPETEAVLGTCAIELRNLVDSVLASAKPESAKELDRIARDAGAAPPEPAELTVPALPIDERASAEIDKLVSAAGSGKRVQVARPGWVAASVLREVASKWAARGDGDARDFDFGQAVCAGELMAIADTAGDAEAVERAAFELVEERLRGVDAATVTLVRDAVMIGTNKMWSERAESAYAAYRALAGKGGEGNHV